MNTIELFVGLFGLFVVAVVFFVLWISFNVLPGIRKPILALRLPMSTSLAAVEEQRHRASLSEIAEDYHVLVYKGGNETHLTLLSEGQATKINIDKLQKFLNS